jgi:16S rRNA (guanine966-N2)-methyltransferase
VFNILDHAPWAPPLEGARVIDLFAGSGALGIEDLSRGAEFALFVETDEAARATIRENLEALGLFGKTRIHRRDAAQLGDRPATAGPPFDVAFLDPPYHRGLNELALGQLARGGWLGSDSVVVLETASDEAFAAPGGFAIVDSRDYGAARVRFLRRTAAELANDMD